MQINHLNEKSYWSEGDMAVAVTKRCLKHLSLALNSRPALSLLNQPVTREILLVKPDDGALHRICRHTALQCCRGTTEYGVSSDDT